MTWWIVILFVGVALSPLVWLRTSARQKGQMAMRLEARRMGLGMQLTQQEWPHWLEVNPPGSCAQYHKARRRGREDLWCYWQSSPGQWLNRWREPCADQSLLDRLQHLPVDVYKAEASSQMIALYWGERGDQSTLQAVARFIDEVA